MTNINRDNPELSVEQRESLLVLLGTRFQQNMKRHLGIEWPDVREAVEARPSSVWSLSQMESTGGEPDVIGRDADTGGYIFCDCSPESPKGRRSVCYDREALDARKDHKPADTAIDMAAAMGISLLTEEQYRALQEIAEVDTKTSSWLLTPREVRSLGGAIFGDRRFGRVFVYHNGADSYYQARGFRGLLTV